MKQIFDSWARVEGASYYASAGASSGNAAAWYFNTSINSFVQPNNVSLPNYIVSNDSYTNFNLAATLTSSNSDDDAIGLVIAFNRSGGSNNALVIIRTKGGISPENGYGLAIITDTGTTILSNLSQNGVSGGWSGAQSRVEIQRTGDIVKYRVSSWNALTSFSSWQTIDLASTAALQKFRGNQRLGFFTRSQAESTYLNVDMPAGADSTVFSLETDSVWSAENGSWVFKGSSKEFSEYLGDYTVATSTATGADYHIFTHTQRKA
jgi:hypothetical protein